jgi:hypothetical protein
MPHLTKFRTTVTASIAVIVWSFGMSGGPVDARAEIANFTSPTRNIDCLIVDSDDQTSANCVVKNNAVWKSYKKKPADCDLDWSPTELFLESTQEQTSVINTVAVGVCRGDIGPVCPGTCRTLGYGKSETIGRITCTSQKTGMTCVTNKGKRKGFTVNRSGYKLIR